MKTFTTILLLLLVVGGALGTAHGQERQNGFLVRYTFIQSDQAGRFARRFVNYIIPSDAQSTNSEVACLSNQLRATNIFGVVETHLEKTADPGVKNLRLRIFYKDQQPVYRISRIEVSGFDDLDDDAFHKLVREKQLLENRLDLRTEFADFEEQITRSIEKSLRPGASAKYREPIWIDIRLNSVGELEITVTPRFKGC